MNELVSMDEIYEDLVIMDVPQLSAKAGVVREVQPRLDLLWIHEGFRRLEWSAL